MARRAPLFRTSGWVTVFGYPMRTISIAHYAGVNLAVDHPVQWFVHANGSAQSIVAVTLAKLGLQVALHGSRGTDRISRECVGVLRKRNVHVDGLIPVPGPSAEVAIHVDADAQHQWYAYNHQNALGLGAAHLDTELVHKADAAVFYAGFSIPLGDKHGMAGAKATLGTTTTLITALASEALIRAHGTGKFAADLAAYAPDVVVGSESEWAAIGVTEQNGWKLPAWTRHGVVTRGQQSVIRMHSTGFSVVPLKRQLSASGLITADDDNDSTRLPSPNSQDDEAVLVDQTGAGDTFLAAIAATCVANKKRGWPLVSDYTVGLASDLATESVTVPGPGLGFNTLV